MTADRTTLRGYSRLLGLVDAAAAPEKLQPLLEQSGVEYRSLYAGLPEEALGPASLYLFPIDDTEAEWVAELDRVDLHTPCLSLVWSRVDMESLVAHLRAFLFADIGDNMTAMVRFFDPRCTDAVFKDGAAGTAKDMSETIGRLQTAQSLHDALTQIAQQSDAQDADGHQSDIVKTIATQNEQIRGTGGGSNTFPELSEAHLLIDGKAGVEITTPATVHVAAQQAAITTEGHIGIASGRSLFVTIRDTIRLFAQTSPIHFVAAAGDIVLNALTKSIVARAQKQILLESEEILLRAKKFRVEVEGSFLNMDSTGIVNGTTGKFLAHASVHGLPGPKDQMVDLSPKQVCIECLLKAARGGSALALR